MPRINSRSGRSRRRRNGGGRFDPNLFVLDNTSVDTADTVVNTTLFTNSNPYRVLSSFRPSAITIAPGATATTTYVFVRRLPSGYAAPAITVVTGLTTLVDQPDIVGYGVIRSEAATLASASFEIEMSWLHPNMVLYEGDSLILQAVVNTSSVSHLISGILEFGTRAL